MPSAQVVTLKSGQQNALRTSGSESTRLGNAAVDFDGDDTSGMVQLEGCGCGKDSVAVQAWQGDEDAVFDAISVGIALQKGERVVVAADFRQEEAEVGYVAGL